MSAALDEPTLNLLRSQPCPFDDVVRPQYADGRFQEVHVPEVLRAPREKLLAAIEHYRVAEYRSLASLPPTRVVTVLGNRGAGKTHLLESILQRPDGRPQLIVHRQTESYDSATPLEEYLLQLLFQTLLEKQPVGGYRPFEAVAAQLTRRILLQAVRALGPAERLQAVPASRWERFCLLWRGSEEIVQRFDDLAEELEDPASSGQLSRLAERHQLATGLLESLALAHLNHSEKGEEVRSVIRRELYGAMIRATLRKNVDVLGDFLEADYRPRGAGVSPASKDAGETPAPRALVYRADVVRHLLHVVVEACALVRLPIVIAFDNLEGLLAPTGKLEPNRATAFLEGLAQMVDHVRGFLILLFAEQGLFLEARKYAGTFAHSRLDQGANFLHGPALPGLELQPPGPEEVRQLALGRMRKIREQLPNGDQLPASFPFPNDVLEQIGSRKGQFIRGKLETLREEYNRIVFGQPPGKNGVVVPTPDKDPERERRLLLERTWQAKLSAADQQLTGSLTSHSKALTQSLGELLQTALPLPDALAAVTRVSPIVTVGDEPRYGHAALLEVTASAGTRRVALGLLLATGTGMKLDLQAKLGVFTDEAAQADYLIVFWNTTRKAQNLVDVLPEGTRKVWNDENAGRRAGLRGIDQAELRKLMAWPLWRREVRQQDPEIPESALRQFVHDHCASVLALLRPLP